MVTIGILIHVGGGYVLVFFLQKYEGKPFAMVH